MANEAIEVGDLVAVVRGHECVINQIGGIPWTVASVTRHTGHGRLRCDYCGYAWPVDGMVAAENAHYIVPVAWLKKFPPLDALTETEQSVTA